MFLFYIQWIPIFAQTVTNIQLFPNWKWIQYCFLHNTYHINNFKIRKFPKLNYNHYTPHPLHTCHNFNYYKKRVKMSMYTHFQKEAKDLCLPSWILFTIAFQICCKMWYPLTSLLRMNLGSQHLSRMIRCGCVLNCACICEIHQN